MPKLPSETVAWEGAPIAFQNAEEHLKAAQLLSEDQLYGLAVSHLVLAAEEAAKASMLAIYGIGVLPILEAFRDIVAPDLANAGINLTPPRQYLEKILYRHTTKHEAAYWIILSHWLISNSERFQNTCLSDQFELFLESIFLDQETRSLFELAAWLEHADKIKQRGFYVDPPEEDNVWLSPTACTQEDYKHSFGFVNGLLEILREMTKRFDYTEYTPEQARAEFLEGLPQVILETRSEVEEFTQRAATILQFRIHQLIQDSPHLTTNENGELVLHSP